MSHGPASQEADVASPSLRGPRSEEEQTAYPPIDDTFTPISIAQSGTKAVEVGKDNATNTTTLEVLDLTDITQPKVVGKLQTNVAVNGNGTRYMGVALNGSGTLAVMAMGNSGIWMVDVSNSASPNKLSEYNTPGTAFAVALNSTATLAYVADGTGHLQIINISNPSAPSLAGSLSFGTYQQDIAVVGTNAYLADSNYSLEVVDVSNAAAPFLKATLALSGSGRHVAVNGTLAGLVTSTASNDLLEMVNISNPAAPVKTGSAIVGAVGIGKGVKLSGLRGYVAANTDGLKIYDVSNPATPIFLSAGYTVGDAMDVVVSGTYAYVADFPATISVVALP